MSRIVIGTAGHIDHGKTALVQALTGVDTDRLKEEKERGITIELGYASLVLPKGTQAAIIDVPGHERFIKQMLAGATGIDIALLIVAANEGVMPQTREHLAIIRLLAVKKIIIVITKIDLVEQEFLGLIQEEVQDLLQETPYASAPIIEVSAYTGQGLGSLLEVIEGTILVLPERKIKEGLARLPVDRAFTKPGFGTVVTGTLFDGIIRVGDLLEIPSKIERTKVRSLQIHGQQVQEAKAGQRVAANLAGVELDKIERGDVLATLGWLSASNRMDLSVQLLKDSSLELVDMARVRFHQGTKETLGRVFVLGQERLLPGEEGFVQIVLEEPIVVLRGDNYILRSYSPMHTIGGGRIIEPRASKHKKSQSNLREELAIKAASDVNQLAAYILEQSAGIVSLESLARELGISDQETRECLRPLLEQGIIREIKGGEGSWGYLSSAKLQDWEESISREIKLELASSPLSPGLNKEIARCKIGSDLSVRDFNTLIQLMIEHRKIRLEGKQYLLLYDNIPQIPEKIAESLKTIRNQYREAGWQVPEWKAVQERLALDERESKQLQSFLLREGTFLQLRDDLYLSTEMYEGGRRLLQTWFQQNPDLTVAQFRDMLGTTRRVAVPLLEYLDKVKVTKKDGDIRLAGPALVDTRDKAQL